MLARLSADARAEFETGPGVERVDAVIYATGYRYDFPFLEGTAVESPSAAEPRLAADGSGGGGGSSGGGTAAANRSAAAAGAVLLSTREQRVAPLYRHMYFPPLAPSLAFIGVGAARPTVGQTIQNGSEAVGTVALSGGFVRWLCPVAFCDLHQ
jgi:hypothetical protein